MDELTRIDRALKGSLFAIAWSMLAFCLSGILPKGSVFSIFAVGCWFLGILCIIGYACGWDIKLKEAWGNLRKGDKGVEK